ncbi:MAG: hypothetical protein MO852_14330 [Candidatus Devosia euplotis]|nr:hypothetical protein [Candidatus Devosia euplotis]
MIAASIPGVALSDQNEVVGVAIYFQEADGSTKPYLFHDLNNPLLRWYCEARLDYLTKKLYRMSRSNPDLKGKKAVRSDCARVEGFDFGSQ